MLKCRLALLMLASIVLPACRATLAGECWEYSPWGCAEETTGGVGSTSTVEPSTSTTMTTSPGCGNDVCDADESYANCLVDCVCGNGSVDAKDDSTEEVCDAGPMNSANAWESEKTCTDTCNGYTQYCGDGIPNGPETCDDGPANSNGWSMNLHCNATCDADGPYCGDGTCQPPQESLMSCPADCPTVCGDSLVEGNEACDDGNADDTDACTNVCQIATCGDGSVQTGVETCDDSNTINTDACTKDCALADCGDGIVWDGEEECDDGNEVDTDACLNTCLKPRRVIFVTSAKFEGDLGGITAIDLKCQTAAMAAGLANAAAFKAWISNVESWPAMRMDTSYPGMYVLVDGTPVAENGWTDLIDGTLSHAIDRTEAGTPADSAPWTNTKADGTPVAGSNHCMLWTSINAMSNGHHGFTTVIDSAWTDAMATAPCSGSAPLYCIEDP